MIVCFDVLDSDNKVKQEEGGDSSTLTVTYTDNRKVIVGDFLENIHLDVNFTATSTNVYALILLEGSNDGGTTYFPIGTKSVGTDEILMYVEDADGNSGIPIIIPGDKTSTAGTGLSGGIDFYMVADHVRVSAKSSSSTSPGTIYVRATLTSN